MRRFGIPVGVVLAGLVAASAAFASSDEVARPYQPVTGWPHHGIAATYDKAALQRGFQVYKDVCSSCHSLNLLAYRHLEGIGLTKEQVKAVAASTKVKDGPDDQGDMFERPGEPSDRFNAPFANEQAARVANNGALPPDLSLIVKAREGHEDYIFSLLTGYAEAPAGKKVSPGMYYNPYFPGHQIAMPPPLTEGAVTYADGNKATVNRMASDVTQFLAWAGDPHRDDRHRMGVAVMLFLIAFAGIMYAVKRRVWSRMPPA